MMTTRASETETDDWTAGLDGNRLFEDHELPGNKDKRLAMSGRGVYAMPGVSETEPLPASSGREGKTTQAD